VALSVIDSGLSADFEQRLLGLVGEIEFAVGRVQRVELLRAVARPRYDVRLLSV
jgi:hypothetical protein